MKMRKCKLLPFHDKIYSIYEFMVLLMSGREVLAIVLLLLLPLPLIMMRGAGLCRARLTSHSFQMSSPSLVFIFCISLRATFLVLPSEIEIIELLIKHKIVSCMFAF